MSEYGLLESGFSRKRLNLLLSELESEFKSIFGDDLNTSPQSPEGQIIGTISESNANLWEIAEDVYNAYNPSAATGNSLSNLVQLNGLTRLPATSSRVQLTINGTNGTVIPVGSSVSTSDTGDTFLTEEPVTISGGQALVFASAVQTGEVQALVGTLTVIDNPITGWDSVTNANDATVGTNEETDADLRARRERSVARDATAIVDAIFAEVASIDGVTQVTVLENDTDATDINGLPPHSVSTIVVGGIDEDIANAIFVKKTLGAQSFGTTTVNVDDTQGIAHPISFSRPTEIDIYVTVNITVINSSLFPANGDELIKQAIVDYANGGLVIGRGFGLAENVIHSELYTPVNSIAGHTVDSLFIGTSASPTGTADISIAITEASNFTTANIVVNVS